MSELEELYKQAEAMSEDEWTGFLNKVLKHKNIEDINAESQNRSTTRFQEMIEFVNQDWKLRPKGFHGLTGEEVFNLYIKDCHPFVFDSNNVALVDIDTSDELQDLPFPIIAIESIKGFLTVPKHADLSDGFPASWISCIVARETAPMEYDFLIHGKILKDNGSIGEALFICDKSDSEVFSIFNGILKAFLNRIPKSKTGIISNPFKAKIGSGKGKTFYKPKNLVVISPKKDIVERIPGLPGRMIEYSHRWEVRGHWRKVNGMGKNRDGVYCVSGNTWVVPTIKGPESAPLIKKTYFVEGE